MDWFLILLLPPIGKDFTSKFPQKKEYVLQIALKYDLIYAQSVYLPIVLLELPTPSGANAPGASHATDGIVGYISYPYQQPYSLPKFSYSQPQGGTSTSDNYLPPPGNPYLGQITPYTYPQSHY